MLLPVVLGACGTATGSDIGFAGTQSSGSAAVATMPPRFADRAFFADDGTRLPLRQWLPNGPVKAVILALHGFGDYSHAFDTPAALWARHGIATYAFDQRGFGAAPDRGRWAGKERLVVDAIEAASVLRQLYPGRPLYLLGESMGGAIAALAMTRPAGDAGASGQPIAAADAVILSAPAVWGRPTMDLLPRLALLVASHLFPEMTLTGRGLHIMASDNIAMLQELARDPLVLKGARVETVEGLVDLMDDALAAAPRLAAPTLLMYGAHDEVIPRQPMMSFVAQLPADPSRHRRLAFYPRGYHLLLRDLEGRAVANDVASWILDHRARLPSRADEAANAWPWPPEAGGSG